MKAHDLALAVAIVGLWVAVLAAVLVYHFGRAPPKVDPAPPEPAQVTGQVENNAVTGQVASNTITGTAASGDQISGIPLISSLRTELTLKCWH